MDAAIVEQEALALTAAERALLADRLLQTLDIEDAARMESWGREAERRLQSFERSGTPETDGPTAVGAIRKRLG